MMGGVSPETRRALYKRGIINFYTLLLLVGCFYMKYTMMHRSTNIKLITGTKYHKIADVSGHGTVSDCTTAALHNAHTEHWAFLETIYKFVYMYKYIYIFCNIRNCSPNHTVTHPRRHECIEKCKDSTTEATERRSDCIFWNYWVIIFWVCCVGFLYHCLN